MGATVLSSSGAGAVVAIFGPEVILVRLALAVRYAYAQNAFQDEADSYTIKAKLK